MRRVGTETYAEMTAVHDRVVRSTLLEHGGEEQGVRGDSFFAVFASPSAAVTAALQIQLTLATMVWPTGENLRVRMGLHTGEVSTTTSGLIGYEIHKAARIGDVGHGGQVLVSSSTAALVADSLGEGMALRSLGSHRLKDLGRPEVIFQLVADGLRGGFPPASLAR